MPCNEENPMSKDVTFVESFELLDLAQKLKERYYLFVGHVDLELMYFAEKVGEKPKKAKIGELSGVSNPWVKALMAKNGKNNKLYCMSVWSAEWAELSPAKREWTVFKLLCSVNPENDGKARKPDIQDFGFILDYFMNEGIGPYWESKDTLPSLLGADPLPIPPPPDDTDEGSTLDG
jgi:hypothetical protein